MKTIDTKLETLKVLIDPLLTGASIQKKKYAQDLFMDIIYDVNSSELNLINLKAKINGFDTAEGYMTELHKAFDVLILMGASDIAYDMIEYKNMRWLCENNEKQNKPFTFIQLYEVNRMLTIFFMLENRMPNNTDELKDYFKKE